MIVIVVSVARLVGFSAMNALVGLAKRADAHFKILYNCIGEPLLAVTGMAADRTQLAQACQSAVQGGDAVLAHNCSPFPMEKALPSSGPTP